MTKRTTLFTIIWEYRGGTFTEQVEAPNVASAFRTWAGHLGKHHLKSSKKVELDTIDEDDEPVPLDERENIWCTNLLLNNSHLLANFVATVRSDRKK